MKAFETFCRQGSKFIAVPNNNGVVIIDDEGNNYGSYYDIKSFEDYCARNGGFVACRLGKAQLQVMAV